MNYGKLGEIEPHGHSSRSLPDQSQSVTSSKPVPKKRNLIKLIMIPVAIILLAATIAVVLVVALTGKGTSKAKHPTESISRICSRTLYPSLCINSLVDFPGALTASDKDLVHISVNMTLSRFTNAFDVSMEVNNLPMDPHARYAYEDCLELLEDTMDHLGRSLNSISSVDSLSDDRDTTDDVMTWLSTALTNQDTCEEGLSEVMTSNNVKDHMLGSLKYLSELGSNTLAIYAAGGNDFSTIPINNRRLMMYKDEIGHENNDDFPKWLSNNDRILLGGDILAKHAHIIVSKDGNGTYKTIAEAIKKAPEKSEKRIVIYIRAGRYEENNLKVGRKKTNLMFVGEGKGKTIITGKKSVIENKMTTFHTASFAATGAGFIAKDITFENYAGPENHQAVALRVGSDHSVVYRCSILGYQDTLYVHSNRQFFRECDIYGTVDFIFGNAAVVLQSCNIYARKPMAKQKNTITAQNRKDPNQNTGISIHTCKIEATKDLEAAKETFATYLGRPWKMYSRTVYLQSAMGDHIHPEGWLAWNGDFALDTLYYGEYLNYGPGAGTAGRVNWPGYRNMSRSDATKFTVSRFISGSEWLPMTGVAFLAGLQT